VLLALALVLLLLVTVLLVPLLSWCSSRC